MYFDAASLQRLARRLWLRGVPVLPRVIDGVILVVFSAVMPYTAEIGEGTIFAHRGVGVVVHPHSRIGRNCAIGPNVVLGSRHNHNPPTLEDGVIVGASAVVIGEITVGRDAHVGAGAVVLCDVPAGGVVVGNPARLVSVDRA
jgi:serine O-acetyltransferase